MNADLTQKLVKRFPVLYQDYDSPMTQTCMCWGFDPSDGWFEIIWQLTDLGHFCRDLAWAFLMAYSLRRGHKKRRILLVRGPN